MHTVQVLGVTLSSDFLWEHRVPLLGALFLALGVEVVQLLPIEHGDGSGVRVAETVPE